MLVLSMRMPKKKWAILSFVVLALCIVGVFLFSGDRVMPTGGKAVIPGSTNEERITYLESFGWQVEPEPCEIVEVQIPPVFNDIYEQYNDIQKKQNFDLKKYAGKRVKRFCYIVTNYPNYPDDIRANLLISEGKIIGGDICSLSDPGFLHEFKKI